MTREPPTRDTSGRDDVCDDVPACLIEAAPDLLCLAKKMQAALGRLAQQGMAGTEFNALLKEVNSAIAKAEGRS